MLIRGLVRLHGLFAVLVWLPACGGGGGGSSPALDRPPVIAQFDADRSSYFVGERARFTVRFENGMARLQPGDQVVQNGQTVSSQMLYHGRNEFELVVTNGAVRVSRTVPVNAVYRERMRSIDTPFARAEHAAVRLNDGRVLIVGGDDEESIFPSVLWVFDPATEQFSNFGPALSTGRIGFVTVMLLSGEVLIAGGQRSLIGAPSAEIIRPAAGVVVPTAPMQLPRTAAAATLLLDGRVFISGGASLAASDTVEIYDPATNAFTLLSGRLAVGRYNHTVVRINERRIFIYGGFTFTGQPAPPELYDLEDAVSTTLPAAEPNSRAGHITHTMQDGGVLILGGEDDDAVPLNTVLRFDPASNAITPFANMATPRTRFALGRLADARILATGGVIGQSQSNITDTTETLARDGTRQDGPTMETARWLHTVTPLTDGRLLIVGGLGADRFPLYGAEIYE